MTFQNFPPLPPMSMSFLKCLSVNAATTSTLILMGRGGGGEEEIMAEREGECSGQYSVQLDFLIFAISFVPSIAMPDKIIWQKHHTVYF